MKELRRNEWVTPEVASSRMNITQTLIRKWAQRYELATNSAGQYMYRELVEIEHQTRHGKGSRRKLTIAI